MVAGSRFFPKRSQEPQEAMQRTAQSVSAIFFYFEHQ